MRTDRECGRAAVVGGGVKLLAVCREPAGVVDGIELGHCSHFAGADFRIDILQRVSRLHQPVRRRNVLGQGCTRRCGRMVRTRGSRRSGGLGDGGGDRSEGEKGNRGVDFHSFDSTGVIPSNQVFA